MVARRIVKNVAALREVDPDSIDGPDDLVWDLNCPQAFVTRLVVRPLYSPIIAVLTAADIGFSQLDFVIVPSLRTVANPIIPVIEWATSKKKSDVILRGFAEDKRLRQQWCFDSCEPIEFALSGECPLALAFEKPSSFWAVTEIQESSVSVEDPLDDKSAASEF